MKMKNSELHTALTECAAACHMCLDACLGEGDVKMMTKCIRLDLDCAEICTMIAAFVARSSEHASHLLAECAEICGKCAAECEKHDMDHCQECARACRKCEAACKAAKK